MKSRRAFHGRQILRVGMWMATAASLMGMRSTQADEAAPAPVAIGSDMDVALEYTLTVDGAVMDSTEGKAPLRYIQGRKQVIAGLERQLQGLHVGDSKELTVTPEEGYGAADPAAVVEVPNTQLPLDAQPTVGMVLRGLNPDGQSFRATVKEVKDQSVILDLNHPLAGEPLTLFIRVVRVAPPIRPLVGAER
ncbi:MAG: FKBP-type peptidyl-prolyl cis-trans isomerase [candidate division NC10 bacterium]